MTVQGLAIFDGDDTLWAAEELYDAALDRAGEIVAGAGFPADEWRRLQREFDLSNVVVMGMTRERFPKSSADALRHLGVLQSKDVSAGLLDAVVRASESVFSARAALVPSAEDVLRVLSKNSFALALLTKGDPEVQQRRVEDSGLAHWFDLVRIVPEKTPDHFRAIVEYFGCSLDLAWSVGNSLPSDINTALEAGLRAIWIDAYVWEHERRALSNQNDRLTVLDELSDVPVAILAEGSI